MHILTIFPFGIALLLDIVCSAPTLNTTTSTLNRKVLLQPGICHHHSDYPNTVQCAYTALCLSFPRDVNNSKCDCCGPQANCATCFDHSDEDPHIIPKLMQIRVDIVRGRPRPPLNSTNTANTATASSMPAEISSQSPIVDACSLPPDRGHSVHHRSGLRLIRWYYDKSRGECLAFTYYGGGGNPNRFKSRMECVSRCERFDGPVCVMNHPSVPGTIVSSSGNQSDGPCKNWICPSGYHCKQGSMSSDNIACCNSTVEEQYARSHQRNGLCHNRPSWVMNGELIIGSTCSSIECPRPYKCRYNAFFVNCCGTRKQSNRNRRETNITSAGWVDSGKFQGDMAGFEGNDDFVEFLQQIKEWQDYKESKIPDGALRSAVRDPRRLWPDGRVPYVIVGSSRQLQRAVTEAIEEFHSRTCIRFTERTDEFNYLKIIDSDSGCWSYLGKLTQTGAQIVSLSSSFCHDKGSAIHELMHAIGFWHEHQRTDRDRYIEVLKNNIEPDCFRKNFAMAPSDQMRLIGKYDVNSVMHYPSRVCSNGKLAMRVKNTYSEILGYRSDLSVEDVRKVQELYGCSDKEGTIISPETSSCPSTVTRHAYTEDGTSFAVCAVVYDQANCRNNKMYVRDDWKSNNLSHVSMTSRRNWNWNEKVASLEINPGCQIAVCTDTWFIGDCRVYRGGSTGKNIRTLGILERKVSAMQCSCNDQCPRSVTRYFEAKNGKTYPVCAILYDQYDCGGRSWKVPLYVNDDLSTESTLGIGSTWKNQVRSAEVNPGCMLKFCSETSWGGTCTVKKGGRTGRNVHVMDHDVSSFWCSCGAESDTRPDWNGFRRGIEVPEYIPATSHYKPGERTCAVAIQAFDDNGYGLWVANGVRVETRNVEESFSYLTTGRGCTLYHCSGATFTGTCETLGPNKYIPPEGNYWVYHLKSYRCTCD